MNENPNPEFSVGENGISINEPLPNERPSAELAPAKPPEKPSRWLKVLAFVLIVACIAFAATQIDYTAISDNLAGVGYEPSPELQPIIDDIDLTSDGKRILNSTRPELQEAEAFNQNCTRNMKDAAILGCYADNRIYVFNIKKSVLKGIRQNVLAHELLHAVWDRIGRTEQERLKGDLKSIYDSNESVRKHLSAYGESEMYNELHSVVGTQVPYSKLSQTLQKHYGKYFNNQGKIADYYKSYNSVFEKARQRLDELEKEIAEHRKKYEEMSQKYNSDNAQLKQDVNDFNARAQNGTFKTIEEFDTERNSLVVRENQLLTDYEALTSYLAETNQLINEYNNNVALSNTIQESIDSKYKKPDNTKANNY